MAYMGDIFTTAGGQRYRYDQPRNTYQQETTEGWFDLDNSPVTYTTEGWFETPATKPPTGLDGWNTADPNDRSWRYLSDELRIFYNDQKQAAYGQYLDDQVGTNATPLRAYLQQNYDRAVREYYRANETDPTLMFTDTLDANFINQLRQSFQMQSPGNKGYNLQWMPQGRYTG